MPDPRDINEYVASLKASPRLGRQVVYHHTLPVSPALFGPSENGLTPPVYTALKQLGIARLYRHQAEAVQAVQAGRHVVVATPTASGKSLIYNIPVLEAVGRDPETRALYLFPLKALAQDQLRAFRRMAEGFDPHAATAEIYDGDTTQWHRRRIRDNPPNVVMTNPDMLHLSLLPHHHRWTAFLRRLSYVVIDEVHTYRGVMGSHMAQVFRRLLRVCRVYGVSPTFIFSSATVANPSELAEQLTGLPVFTVEHSSAPRGRKHLIFVDPVQGPAQTAILLLKAALHRNLRTIVYAQSRKMTELIALWAGSRAGRFSRRISAYRAGFLPEERREIEARLTRGDLLAVISTSALELGIDIGDLDLCLLVGYPGTIVATWQRSGRVGRSGQDSAVVLIGGEDALDQYFMRNPLELVAREAEAAVVNPHNPHILKQHLICAATEVPLASGEPFLQDGAVQHAVARLAEQGKLLLSGEGDRWFSTRKMPHREVDLRGTGDRFTIVCSRTGEQKGEVDGFRAFRETHPGAVYIHNSRTYIVESLDLETRTVRITPAQVDYYTRVRANKDTEIISVTAERPVWASRVCTGRLRVTDHVVGYETWRIYPKRKMNIHKLDLPPQTFETEGLWVVFPPAIQRDAEARFLHFMGGIHAVEHAAIGIFPLLVMADRNDLGGISIPYHPQIGAAAVFIYDAVPGGAGLTRQAFQRAESLLSTTHKAITSCGCATGCPSCVHSPKCGSGNRPIDKAAAAFILAALQEGRFDGPSPGGEIRPAPAVSDTTPSATPETGSKIRPANSSENTPSAEPENRAAPAHARFGVLDVETRRSADEVGGWHKADRMGISCAVLYDAGTERFSTYLQEEVPALVAHLQKLDLVVGFNIKRFDYLVLSGLSDFDFRTLETLDILEVVRRRLGYRLSLDHLARVTLGERKTADGLQALKWWKEGRIREIIDYCRMDVAVTRDLYSFGQAHGYLLFENKGGQTVRVPVAW